MMTSRGVRRWLPVAALGACCALLAGCSGSPPPGAPPPPAGGSNAAPPNTPGQPAPHDMGGAGALSATSGSPAEKALQLEALLGQHSVLAADLMRGRIRNDEDFGQAANSAIGRNSDDLAAVVGSLFGADAGNAFRPLWAEHVTEFFNYSRGLATNDTAVRDGAKADLAEYEGRLAGFFSSASQGRLPQDAAQKAVTTHIDHLLDQADAYAAKDFARSDALYRESYAHTFELGHTLAATLLPPDQAGTLDEPSWRLRSALDKLLGEHVALAVGALRAGGTNSPDFPAAVSSLNGNTRDLAGAMGTLFGAQAGQQFLSMWADHIDQLIAYTTGVVRNDPASRDAAQAQLRGFENKLATFLDSATGGKAPSADLAKAYLGHDEMLTQQVDAFSGGDFPRAHELAYNTYQDMFTVSGTLADAFGETVAARLPRGGAETGAGGRAQQLGG